MARGSNKPKERCLISLIEMGNQKLYFKDIKRSLISDKGRGTVICDRFEIDTFNSNFLGKDNSQTYDKSTEIFITDMRYRLIIGQGGLFLNEYKDTPYSKVKEIIQPFIDYCKLFLFTPIGVAHWSDGDEFIYNEDQYFEYLRYIKKENIDLFNTDDKEIKK